MSKPKFFADALAQMSNEINFASPANARVLPQTKHAGAPLKLNERTSMRETAPQLVLHEGKLALFVEGRTEERLELTTYGASEAYFERLLAHNSPDVVDQMLAECFSRLRRAMTTAAAR